jgi:NAD(P)H-dependent nitrite reductase small subunit
MMACVAEQLEFGFEPIAVVSKQGVFFPSGKSGGVSVQFVPIAKVGDVAPGSATTVVLDGRDIALFNVDGAFYALDNSCPHQGGPLAEGWIEGLTVTCPWHAWCFRLDDGRMTLGDFAAVDAFAVRVEGETVSVARSPKPN